MCYQPRLGNTDIEMSEDCLFLNIFTKSLNASAPVLVFIHGGGFYVGNSLSNDTVNPEYLIDTSVVIVSFNYRLGTLGNNQFETPQSIFLTLF